MKEIIRVKVANGLEIKDTKELLERVDDDDSQTPSQPSSSVGDDFDEVDSEEMVMNQERGKAKRVINYQRFNKKNAKVR